MDKRQVIAIAEMVDGFGFAVDSISQAHEDPYEPINLVIRKKPPEELAAEKGPKGD
jgi:hypothetical protein